jgi:phage antirepressor YoqD-like protein
MLTSFFINNTTGLRSKKTGLMEVKRSERKNNTKELRIHLVTIVGEEPCTNLV